MWGIRAYLGLALGLLLISGVSCSARSLVTAHQAEAFGPKPPAEAKEASASSVEVATVKKGSLDLQFTYTGNVQSRWRVQVLPKVAGRLERLHVDVGSFVRAGDVIAELDDRPMKAQEAQAEAALALAEAKLAALEDGPRSEQVALARANLKAAEEKLAGLRALPRAEQVAQAEANLKAAEARLEELRIGPRSEQIAVAETQVRMAKNQLYAVQAQADLYLGGGNWIGGQQKVPYSKDLKEAQSGVAWEQVKLAEAQLAALKAGASEQQIAQAEAAVEAARQQLALARNPITEHDLGQAEAAVEAARQQLALAERPFTEHDLEAARAGVAQARAALELARLQVEDAVIRAPFDGVVAQRFLSPGAMAAPSTPIISLISTEVEVTIDIEEARLAEVRPGQPATITVAAYPDQEFAGTVVALSPALDPRSRTAYARIQPSPEALGKLMDGMFAQVKLGGSGSVQSLLVPSQAIIQEEGRTVVFLVNEGKAVKRNVTLGASDGRFTQVLSGLSEGDRVVIAGQENLRDGQPLVLKPQE